MNATVNCTNGTNSSGCNGCSPALLFAHPSSLPLFLSPSLPLFLSWPMLASGFHAACMHPLLCCRFVFLHRLRACTHSCASYGALLCSCSLLAGATAPTPRTLVPREARKRWQPWRKPFALRSVFRPSALAPASPVCLPAPLHRHLSSSPALSAHAIRHTRTPSDNR